MTRVLFTHGKTRAEATTEAMNRLFGLFGTEHGITFNCSVWRERAGMYKAIVTYVVPEGN